MNIRVYDMLNKKMFGQEWGLSAINGYSIGCGRSACSRRILLGTPFIYQFRYVEQIDRYIEER